MSYFKINNVDFSSCVNSLDINETRNIKPQVNAAGNTVIDYINRKVSLSVGIIPLTDAKMKQLLEAIDNVEVSITYRNPLTNADKTIKAYISDYSVSYYTIQNTKVMYQAFTLSINEL